MFIVLFEISAIKNYPIWYHWHGKHIYIYIYMHVEIEEINPYSDICVIIEHYVRVCTKKTILLLFR